MNGILLISIKSKKMKELIISTLMTVVLLIGCSSGTNQRKYVVQLNTIDTLIEHFRHNDYLAVKRMIGTDLDNIAMNEEILIFRVNKMHHYLTFNKVANKKAYEFVEYSKNDPLLVDIVIPLHSSKKIPSKIILTVFFAKYIDKNKILDFRIND
jgi:hypothetical protein